MSKVFTFENKGDNKGPVINLDFGDMKVVEMPIFYRKKGQSPEGHFHKDADPSHDPQYVYVLKGTMEFTCTNLQDQSEVLIVSERQGIILPKYIFHRYKALEDVIFCEPRLRKYSPGNTNTFLWDEFRKLIFNSQDDE